MTRKAYKETGEVGKRWVEYYPDGQYGKVGGGLTPHLQEAQVLGWNAPKALEKRVTHYRTNTKWKDYHPGYELVQVVISRVDGKNLR